MAACKPQKMANGGKVIGGSTSQLAGGVATGVRLGSSPKKMANGGPVSTKAMHGDLGANKYMRGDQVDSPAIHGDSGNLGGARGGFSGNRVNPNYGKSKKAQYR